jgi:hypothetical protein
MTGWPCSNQGAYHWQRETGIKTGNYNKNQISPDCRNAVLLLPQTFPWVIYRRPSIRFKLLMTYSTFKLDIINITPHLIIITFLTLLEIRLEEIFIALYTLANHTLMGMWLYTSLKKVSGEIKSFCWYLWPSFLFHKFFAQSFCLRLGIVQVNVCVHQHANTDKKSYCHYS